MLKTLSTILRRHFYDLGRIRNIIMQECERDIMLTLRRVLFTPLRYRILQESQEISGCMWYLKKKKLYQTLSQRIFHFYAKIIPFSCSIINNVEEGSFSLRALFKPRINLHESFICIKKIWNFSFFVFLNSISIFVRMGRLQHTPVPQSNSTTLYA